MESILEGNKLIAEFMGCMVYISEPLMKVCADDKDHDGICYHCEWHPEYTRTSNVIAWIYEPDKNWCQLMPVVKKIYDYLQNIERPLVNHCWKGYLLEVDIACWIREVNIKKAHEAVIEFIKWYNTQPKTDKIK